MPTYNNQELKVELVEKEIFKVELKTIDIISGSNRYGVTVINNFTALIAPTANDDSGDEYTVGSNWIDIIANKSYICVDNTLAHAIWLETDVVSHEALFNHANIHPKELNYDSAYKCFNVNN